MKRIVKLSVILIAILAFNCSNDPASPLSDVDDIQFSQLAAEINAISVDDPGDAVQDTNPRLVRLKKMIGKLKVFIKRLARFEKKYPNDEAKKLIRQSIRYYRASIEAFKIKEYRKSFRVAKSAREKAREALALLKPAVD